MEQVGIWLDSDNAHIITIRDGVEQTKVIESNVDHHHLHGGYGGSIPYNAQDSTSQGKLLERKKHQLKNYFEEVINEVKQADQVAVFGPAETPVAFAKYFKGDRSVAKKLVHFAVADSMTENQIIALVRDYFNSQNQ